MTTVIGLIARKGTPGIVIASDSRGLTKDYPNSPPRTTETRKVFVNRDQTVVMGMSGLRDYFSLAFAGKFYAGEISLEKGLKNKYLKATHELNFERMNGSWSTDKETRFIFASRLNGELRLYHCTELGKITEGNYYAIGSGGKLAEGELVCNRDGYISPQTTSLEEAYRMVRRALTTASKDPHTDATGVFDLTVVLQDRIIEYGDRVQDHFTKASQTLDQILGKEIKGLK